MSNSRYLYAPYYCEENIWQLCSHQDFAALERRVVFISNQRKSCALRFQRAAADSSQFVFWDYHVILLCREPPGTWQIWDLDTLAGMPLPVQDYLSKTFVVHNALAEYMPLFKVIDALYFIENFSSDRAHMRTASGGWSQPPPPWAPLQKGSTSNLMSFVDVADDSNGVVLDLAAFAAEFTSSNG